MISVKELKKTPSGRAYLEKLQKQQGYDLLQPSDPMFNKVWGKKLKENQEIREKQIKQNKEAQIEMETRKNFVKNYF